MRRALGAGLLTACLLSAAACSADEPEAASSPTAPAPAPEPSASPSASPSVAAPTMPPEATERTAEGAEAFARFYFDAVNYGFATGDTSLVEQYSLDECRSCYSTIEYIREPFTIGGLWDSVDLLVHEAAAPPPDGRGAIITMTLEQREGFRVGADGTRSDSPGVPIYSANMYAEWRDSRWRVYALSNVE